jgi:hypothetical protein
VRPAGGIASQASVENGRPAANCAAASAVTATASSSPATRPPGSPPGTGPAGSSQMPALDGNGRRETTRQSRRTAGQVRLPATSSGRRPASPRSCLMLASHRDHTASALPCAEISALRGAAACQAASTRATCRSGPSIGTPAGTSVDSRRAAGIRRITTRWSQTRPSGPWMAATPGTHRARTAGSAPPRGGTPPRVPWLCEVEETEIDRLLHLVGALTRQEDNSRMRLRHRGVSLACPALRYAPRHAGRILLRRQRRRLVTRPGHLPAPPAKWAFLATVAAASAPRQGQRSRPLGTFRPSGRSLTCSPRENPVGAEGLQDTFDTVPAPGTSGRSQV